MIFKDLAEASACCAYWRELLGLTHWQIALSSPYRLGPTNNRQGECNYDLRSFTANISILAHESYPEGPHEFDQEETLVHELLHLLMAPVDLIDDGDLRKDIAVEQIINLVARALVTLNRR